MSDKYHPGAIEVGQIYFDHHSDTNGTFECGELLVQAADKAIRQAMEAQQADLATLRKQLANAREEAKELRHWAFNHVDAMLLYISYPEDSHVKEAVEFCKIIAPERKMRMNHLQGSGFHPAREALKGQPC